jgi:hypothetical protein
MGRVRIVGGRQVEVSDGGGGHAGEARHAATTANRDDRNGVEDNGWDRRTNSEASTDTRRHDQRQAQSVAAPFAGRVAPRGDDRPFGTDLNPIGRVKIISGRQIEVSNSDRGSGSGGVGSIGVSTIHDYDDNSNGGGGSGRVQTRPPVGSDRVTAHPRQEDGAREWGAARGQHSDARAGAHEDMGSLRSTAPASIVQRVRTHTSQLHNTAPSHDVRAMDASPHGRRVVVESALPPISQRPPQVRCGGLSVHLDHLHFRALGGVLHNSMLHSTYSLLWRVFCLLLFFVLFLFVRMCAIRRH